jgi:hypothetical protein
MEKRYLNMPEFMADEDEEQAFDQACKHENRLGCHGTYCHHPDPKIGGGKCSWRWTSSEWHKDCPGFEANPEYKGQWESVQKPPDHDEWKAKRGWRTISSISVQGDDTKD